MLHRLIDAVLHTNQSSDLDRYVAGLQRRVAGGPTLEEAKKDYRGFRQYAPFLG